MALQQGTYKWKIKDEDTINKILKAKNGEKFKSDVFEIGKLEWRIILCPNGLTSTNKDRFCIYLRLLSMSDKWKYIILCQTISCKQTMNGCTAIVKYERNGQSKGSQNGIYLLSKLKEENPKSITCSVNITILKITLKNDYILFKHDLSFNSYYNNKQEIKWKIKPKLLSKFKDAYPGQPFEDKQNNNWRLVCYPNGNTDKYQGIPLSVICEITHMFIMHSKSPIFAMITHSNSRFSLKIFFVFLFFVCSRSYGIISDAVWITKECIED